MGDKDDDDENNPSITVGRYPCMPSLVALQQMRNRLHLAYLGKKLMKWSALATGRELRRIAQELNESYGDFSTEIANCYMMLARCRYYYPNINRMVLEDIQREAALTVSMVTRSSAGVKLVSYEVLEKEPIPYQYRHLGIDKGGCYIKETKLAWIALLKRMILILQLRISYINVEIVHKAATK